MERMEMHTRNLADEKFRKLAELFPDAVTETIDPESGEVVRAIDKDVLMQEISTRVVEGREERYQFTWPDKRRAILAANAPVSATLRPIRAESVGRDGTPGGFDSENLYIEGDNLPVLKLLEETYLGKVKLIYIDPPYNTGADLVYEDDFTEEAGKFVYRGGYIGEEGERLVQNIETNGRFHTDWINMIFPRLRVAKNLLTDDGVIFISIDDHEQGNLRKICDEVFGGQNFIAQIVWERAFSPVNLKKHFSVSHDYILCYARNIEHTICNGLPRSDSANERYSNPDNDPRGPWTSGDLSVGPRVESRVYEIVTPGGKRILPPSGYCWRLDSKTFASYVKDNRIWFGDGNNVPRIKRFLSEVKQGITPMTIWKYDDVGHSQYATKKLKELFDGKAVFDYPKSVELIKRCIQLYSDKDTIVMDFFSGSATTAHAVIQLNAEDGGHRRFIMVQLPEVCGEGTEAYKAGYKNICEIGKERIRRAARKIREEAGLTLPADFDGGFRCLRLDSSNMQDVYYNPAATSQDLLGFTTDNIKPDRTPEDLLFQVMLELGVALSSSIAESTVAGKKIFDVADGYLLACFDEGVNTETVTAIAKKEPYYAVFRDSSMADDSTATNFDQIFQTYSPTTVRKVL